MERSFDPVTKFFLEELKMPELADRRLQNAARLCIHEDRTSCLGPEILELYRSESDPRILSLYLVLLKEIDNFTPEQILEVMSKPVKSRAWVQVISEIVERQGKFEDEELPRMLESLALISFRQDCPNAQAYALEVLSNFVESLSPRVLAAAAFGLGSDSEKNKRHAIEIIASIEADKKGLIPALFYEYQFAKTLEVQAEFGTLIRYAAPDQPDIIARLLYFSGQAEVSREARLAVKIPPGFEEIFHFAAEPFVHRPGYNEEIDLWAGDNLCTLSHFHWLALNQEHDENKVAERLDLLARSGSCLEYVQELFREIIQRKNKTPELVLFEAAVGILSLGDGSPDDFKACYPIIINYLRDQDPALADKARFYVSCFLGYEHGPLSLQAIEVLAGFLVADEISDIEKTKMIRSWSRSGRTSRSMTEAYLQLLAPVAWNRCNLYASELQHAALRLLVRSHFKHFDAETKQSFTALLADLAAEPGATIELKEMHRRCEKLWLMD